MIFGESVRRPAVDVGRLFRHEPAFVLAVTSTFALAIGANAAMFGLVTRLMLAPPAGIGAPEGVARVGLSVDAGDGTTFTMPTTSYPNYRALAAATNAFSSVAASHADSTVVGVSPAVAQIPMLGVSGGYFATLRATPALGRFFGPGDDEPPAGNPVVVLGYDYWQREFGGARSSIGRTLVLDGDRFTIIGVARRGFNGDGLAPVGVFIPLSSALRKRNDGWTTNRYMNLISIVARLRDGVTSATAARIATAALRDEASAGGRSRAPVVSLESVVPGHSARSSDQAQIAIWLTGVSLIVLAVATANAGTLLALRAARRRRDVAVRIALGASQSGLARQLLTECLALAALGAASGLVLSRWLSQLLRVVLLTDVATDADFVDGRVLGASIVVAAVAGLLAGLAPLAQLRKTDLIADLRAGGNQGGSSRLGLQSLLVRVQVALCVVLLVGAALFVRSLAAVESQDLGFSTARLLYVTLSARGQHLPGTERDQMYFTAVDRVRRLPSVSRASVAAGIPFGPHNIPPVSVPGVTWPENTQFPIMYGATPDYLAAMDVHLIAGRLFDERDVRASAQVVLVNESMARTAWPGQPALGKCVRAGFATFPPLPGIDPSVGMPCREVVGVVRDSRARSLKPERKEDQVMQYYVPFEQIPETPMPDPAKVMELVVQTKGDATDATADVQRAIQSALPQTFASVRPYQDLIDPQLRSWRLGASLFSAFGALALVIATAGLLGIISYVVNQRTREIGVRFALGATRGMIARLVIADALRMVSVGMAAGLAIALAAGPLIASLLFRTSAHDVVSIITAVAVILAATVVASALPAWRSGRVSPVTALRADG